MELPQPGKVALGQALRGVASEVIDLSDGLAGDLSYVLQRFARRGPRWWTSCRAALAAYGRRRALRHECLPGGDDYELLFTAADEAAAACWRYEAGVAVRASVRSRRSLGCAGGCRGGLWRRCSGASDHFQRNEETWIHGPAPDPAASASSMGAQAMTSTGPASCRRLVIHARASRAVDRPARAAGCRHGLRGRLNPVGVGCSCCCALVVGPAVASACWPSRHGRLVG